MLFTEITLSKRHKGNRKRHKKLSDFVHSHSCCGCPSNVYPKHRCISSPSNTKSFSATKTVSAGLVSPSVLQGVFSSL